MKKEVTNANVVPINKKPKLVFFEDRQDYLNIYALNIIVYTDVEIVVKNDVRELLSYVVEEVPDVVVINKHEGDEDDIAFQLFRLLKKISKQVPTMIIGGNNSPAPFIHAVEKNYPLQKIVRFIASSVGATAEKMASLPVPDFYPIPVKFILPGWQVSRNIYLEKDIDDRKCFLMQGEYLTGEMVDDLNQRGQKYFFVKSEYRLELINSFTNMMVETLQDQTLSKRERNVETEKGYKMVIEQVNRVGVTESSAQMAKATIKSMEQLVSQVPQLDKFLEDMAKDSMCLRYQHSLLASYIGTHIIQKMPWGTKEQQEKLVYVAFFHDIVLTKDEYLLFDSDVQVHRSDLSNKEKELVKNHARLSAKLVSSFPQMPIGLDTLIKQHHGCKMGDSLTKISMAISPLAIVFIFAEEWANMILEQQRVEKTYSKKKVIEYLSKKYKYPNFLKILPVLHELDL